VICNDEDTVCSVLRPREDTDGRARVTTDEERVLHVVGTEMRLCR